MKGKNIAGRLVHHIQGEQIDEIHARRVLIKALKKIRSCATPWAKLVMARDQMVCQLCGIVDGNLHAHHILSRRERPDLAGEVDNGITLCGPCHRKWHAVKRVEKVIETIRGPRL